MKDLTQNVVVELDLDKLSTIIKNNDENKSLLGNWDLTADNFNETILHRFGYLEGTYECIKLLGIILDNIQYSLRFKYFMDNVVDYDRYKIYCIEGTVDDIDIMIDTIYSNDCFDNDLIKNPDEEHVIVRNFRNHYEHKVIIEAKNMINYYKDYFTHMFDISKTIKK